MDQTSAFENPKAMEDMMNQAIARAQPPDTAVVLVSDDDEDDGGSGSDGDYDPQTLRQSSQDVAVSDVEYDDGGSDGDYDPQTMRHSSEVAPVPSHQSHLNEVGIMSPGLSAESAATLIAPMDAAAYDKLDMRHTAPADIKPFARGKIMNRFFDILPNPSTQVQLQMQGTDPATTYINANYVRSFGGRRVHEYIASQGPLPATVDAFVRMIWEQKMVVLVQTTGFVEKGVKKCEEYFPQRVGKMAIGSSGRWTVECKSVDQREGYNCSALVVHNHATGEQRDVVHFWFNTWPDHGVPTKPGTRKVYPDTTLNMLQAVRRTRARMDQNAAPLLVHCSAGVGRTGTFIIIDQVITALEQGKRYTLLYIHFLISFVFSVLSFFWGLIYAFFLCLPPPSLDVPSFRFLFRP